MPVKYMDSFDMIECYEAWAKRQSPESQLEMLRTYRTLLKKGKIEMGNPNPEELEKGREYVNKRIEDLERVMQLVPT